MLTLFLPDAGPCAAYRILAAVLPVLLFWPFFRMRAFGAGDIKLIAVLGLLNGPQTLFVSVFAALLIAAVFGVCLLISKRQFLPSMFYSLSRLGEIFREKFFVKKYTMPDAGDGRMHRICFAPALLGGYITVLALQAFEFEIKTAGVSIW